MLIDIIDYHFWTDYEWFTWGCKLTNKQKHTEKSLERPNLAPLITSEPPPYKVENTFFGNVLPSFPFPLAFKFWYPRCVDNKKMIKDSSEGEILFHRMKMKNYETIYLKVDTYPSLSRIVLLSFILFFRKEEHQCQSWLEWYNAQVHSRWNKVFISLRANPLLRRTFLSDNRVDRCHETSSNYMGLWHVRLPNLSHPDNTTTFWLQGLSFPLQAATFTTCKQYKGNMMINNYNYK